MTSMRRLLLKLCADLREVDQQLAQVCETLPSPTSTFDARAELRGTLECVRTDLLQDAVTTLREAARRGCEAEWRAAYERRVQRLAECEEGSGTC